MYVFIFVFEADWFLSKSGTLDFNLWVGLQILHSKSDCESLCREERSTELEENVSLTDIRFQSESLFLSMLYEWQGMSNAINNNFNCLVLKWFFEI